MTFELALNLLCILFLQTSLGIQAIINGLTVISYLFLFKKCGQAQVKALIPFYRDYAYSQCADREMEGRVYFYTAIAETVIGLFISFYPGSELTLTAAGVVLGILMIVEYVYVIRIALGLIQNFGVTKWWLPLLVLLPFIPIFIWSLSPNYQPHRKVPEIDEDEKSYFQKNVTTLEKGLTVNLQERTVRQFFKKKRLLRDIHLNIKPGSMVLLLGGSGSGKTTLLNAINGYEKAKAEVILDGKNVYKEYKSMQYEIGFVPQLDLMRGNDTILRTLTDAAALRLPQNFSAAERRARVDEVMELFGLSQSKGSMVDKLSGGQRKRLSIAMEFIPNPTLFILDEPDSGLDGVMARSLMTQLRRIADQGKIVIVITHTPDRVIDLFDHVIVLAKDSHRTGRLAFFGKIDEARKFFERDTMEEIVKTINGKSSGGEGRADEIVEKFAEVYNG